MTETNTNEIFYDAAASVPGLFPSRPAPKPPPPLPPRRRKKLENKTEHCDNIKNEEGNGIEEKKSDRMECGSGPGTKTESEIGEKDSEDCSMQNVGNKLSGYMNKVVTKLGQRRTAKQRWFVFFPETCNLHIYKSENESVRVGEIDIAHATFSYDVEKGTSGQFSISTVDGIHELEAGSAQKRLYWLQELQTARRDYSLQRSHIISHPEFRHTVASNRSRPRSGLLKEKNPVSPSSSTSPVPDILSPVERPADLSFNLPQSLKKSAFSLSFSPVESMKKDGQFSLSNLLSTKKSIRSKETTPVVSPATTSTPSAVDGEVSPRVTNARSPNSPASGISQWPHKFRQSFRDRKSSNEKQHHTKPAKECKRCEQVAAKLLSLKEDLQATEDEYNASKEVISILQTQVDTLTREKETLVSLQRSDLTDCQLLEILHTKDSEIVKVQEQNQEMCLQQEKQQSELNTLQEQLTMFKDLLQVKDSLIVQLTNQLHDMESENEVSNKHVVLTVNEAVQTENNREEEKMNDTLSAYQIQNKFLNKEILELNHLRQEACEREQRLLIETSEWEARFYQIQSKYLLLLNELHNPQASVSTSRQEMISQLLEDLVGSNVQPQLRSGGSTYDKFGFRQKLGESLESRAAQLQQQAQNLTDHVQDDQDAAGLENRWEAVISSLDSREFHRSHDIKVLIRAGIPLRHRGCVWKAIIDSHLKVQREKLKPGYYQKLLSNYKPGPHLTPAAKQIELDLLRTLPNNRHYESLHSDGIPKLRRVLLAYSLHNPEVEYCQGFNRLVAIALLFMAEEDAFWCLVYIVENLMPPDYYNKTLIAAQVDQKVLKDLVAEKFPRLQEHLSKYAVDISLFTLNWFLCVFVDNIPVETYLRIWDTFLLEGSKVLFRYALAVLKIGEEEILKNGDYMSIFNCLRSVSESLNDTKKLSQVAFQDLNPFPMRLILTKREHHHKALKAQFDELESIRRDYQSTMGRRRDFVSDEED